MGKRELLEARRKVELCDLATQIMFYTEPTDIRKLIGTAKPNSSYSSDRLSKRDKSYV
jgi:hypothetical protein